MAINKHYDPAGNPPDPASAETGRGPARRPYLPPRVMSAEALEATAGTCDPAVPPFGKPDNPQCSPQTPGS